MNKEKKKDDAPGGRRFLVGMDGRPVRYPMTDETFNAVRERLLAVDEVVSVELLDGGLLKIVKGREASQVRLTHELGELVIQFSFSNPVVIESEKV